MREENMNENQKLFQKRVSPSALAKAQLLRW